MIWRYLLAWLVMPIIGIINGTVREFTYGRHIKELAAHQISTVTGIILFGLYAWLLSLRWKIPTMGQTMIVGLIWLGLTIAFEFLFGHYVMKHPWSRLFHDYNLAEGRIWILVLIWITFAPLVFHKLGS
jgi:hypothetical protein